MRMVLRPAALSSPLIVLLLSSTTSAKQPAPRPPGAADAAPRSDAKADPKADAALRLKLHKSITVAFADESFGKAVERLATLTGCPLAPEWDALAKVGVSRDAPVHLDLRDVPADHVLTLALRQATSGAGSDSPTWSAVKGAVRITPLSAAPLLDATYDVSDLLRASGDEPKLAADRLERLIANMVAPDQWTQNGGTVGEIHFGGAAGTSMQVRAPAAMQEETTALLAAVRDGLAGRGGGVAVAFDRAAYDRTRQRLAQRLPANTVNGDNLPLCDALAKIARAANVNLVLDERAATAAKVDPAAKLSPKAVKGPLPASEWLDTVLNAAQQQNADKAALTVEVDQAGVVLVTVIDHAPSNVRCYDLRPLLTGRAKTTLFAANASQSQRVEAVTRFVQSKITPDGWRETGGTLGSAMDYQGLLVVSHLPSSQEKVLTLLRALP